MKEIKSDRTFYWNQLIKQEIRMFIQIGQKVTDEDIEWLVKRRGFTDIEEAYLRSTMNHVGLM